MDPELANTIRTLLTAVVGGLGTVFIAKFFAWLGERTKIKEKQAVRMDKLGMEAALSDKQRLDRFLEAQAAENTRLREASVIKDKEQDDSVKKIAQLEAADLSKTRDIALLKEQLDQAQHTMTLQQAMMDRQGRIVVQFQDRINELEAAGKVAVQKERESQHTISILQSRVNLLEGQLKEKGGVL